MEGNIVCSNVEYNQIYVLFLFLLVFYRYFSVTRPLTYRAKRTTKRAMTMIGLAWTISFILWAPAILFWQYIVGERTIQPNECYIQFLSEPIFTFCTAIAAFYLPVTIMAILFWKIYQETEKRAKDVQNLKGSGVTNNPSHDQNQGSDSRREGKGSVNSQNISLAMPQKLSSQSSCELYQPSPQSNKPNTSLAQGNKVVCDTICFPFSSLLSAHHTSKRSYNTSKVGEAEHSSCDNFTSDQVDASGDQTVSEVEADGAYHSQPLPGWTQPK